MRIVRRLLHALLMVVTLVLAAVAVAIAVTQTAWFKDQLRAYIVREASRYVNGQLSIQRLGGNLFFGIELENIELSRNGSTVVAVRGLGLDYSVAELFTSGLSLDHIRLNKPVVFLRREGSAWSISGLLKKQAREADREGPARPVSIGEIGISDGSVVVDGPVGTAGVDVPRRFEHLDARMSFRYEPVRYSIEIAHVSFRGSEPAIGLNALSGGVAVASDTLYVQQLALRTPETSLLIDGAVQHYLTEPIFNLRISSDKLSVSEVARLVRPLVGVQLQPAFELSVSGPADRLGVVANVRSSAGQLIGKFTTDLAAPGQSVAGEVSVRHVNVASLVGRPVENSDITADAQVDIGGTLLSDIGSLRGFVRLRAPRIAAAGVVAEQVRAAARIHGRQLAIVGVGSGYGATGTATGIVTVPREGEAWTYDVHGQLRQLDLRRLPSGWRVPAVATNITADYHVIRGPVVARGAATVIKSDVTFLESIVEGTRIAAGSRASFSIAGGQIGYQADGTVADVDLQRMGEAFKVKAIATDLYKSRLNGHIVARVEGTNVEEMSLTANGILTDSLVFGAQVPELSFDVAVAENMLHVKSRGQFAELDPAMVSGKPALKGEVAGEGEFNVTVSRLADGVTADNVRATARINVQPSIISGLSIDRATIDGDYRDAAAIMRVLDMKGRDINLSASGTLALNETGQSDLKFHADTPSLDEIGRILERPIRGIANVDGIVTGNGRELQAAGNAIGDAVAYRATRALTVSTNYTIRVPDLAFGRAHVTADSEATFVTLAGHNINELIAKTEYNDREITFNATARQPQRSLTTSGSLLLHPDHQEVYLQQFSVQAQAKSWELAAASEPAIQYGANAIAVDHLELVSGDQTITATGVFGHPDEELQVVLNRVDLASLDALLLRPSQFSGRLNATATVGGTKDAPRVEAEFTVDAGGFRQFRYDTFSGMADYSGKGVNVDATLQQSASSWITAKGYVPIALFKGDVSYEHPESEAPEARVDLHIESSPMDLGIVQGFTTTLTNVSGIVRATIDVTGSAGDPHPTGFISVENGTFTLAPAGVTYTGAAGRIDLQPDRVHIDGIKVLDNRQRTLSVTGDLAIHEFDVGNVNLTVKADDFKVIDNAMGDVRIDTDLRVAGELRQPRIEGALAVSTGVLNLDPILVATGESAYAIKPAEYGPAAPGTSDGTAPLSSFEALGVDIHFTVPNALVVKGTDLRPSGVPIGLGSLNLTLGGDLWISKVPYDQARLTGVVNTVRGTYNFQGRRFEILRDGTVRFDGLDALDPSLDIRTQRVIQAVTADVNIRGTFRKPEITLTSTPPLEEADILALIVFNQPINQLGEGAQTSVAQRAQALATGAAAGQLARSIGKVLNVDTFEIITAPERGGVAELTVGQQVGQNLYVKVQQGFGEQSQTNFVLEYELAKWLRLRTNVLQGPITQQQLFQHQQGSGLDLLFFLSY